MQLIDMPERERVAKREQKIVKVENIKIFLSSRDTDLQIEIFQ